MEEIWRDIKGYEGHYQVSNLGNVKSLYFKNGKVMYQREKILAKHINPNGYFQICLFKNGKRNWASIHRLVGEAFIPNPNNLKEINHKDENPKNNKVSNLEWCDRTYNNNYGNRTMKASKQIKQLDLEGNVLRIWLNGREIQRHYGYSYNSIWCACNGVTKQSHGYRWEYLKKVKEGEYGNKEIKQSNNKI